MWGSLAATAAATPLALTGAAPASASSSDVLVIDLEVATVTDTSVVITWFTGSSTETDEYGFPAPVATDTVLQLGSADLTTLTLVPGTLKTVLDDATPTAYHYAEVTGLQPDTPYFYVAMSNGQTAQQTSMQFPVGVGGSLDYPGIFSTLATPSGSYLFTLALSNDLHMGEGESGIIENNWPPAFEQDPGLPGYPVVMLQAMLGDLRQPDRGADRLIVAGDLTSSAELSQAQQVRQMLDGWGTIQQDYFVARGNHDRSMVGSTYAACTPVPNTSPQHYDCWGDVFPYPLQTLQSYEVGGLRLIGLDTTMLDLAGGTMSAGHLECSSTTAATRIATSGPTCSTTASRRSSRSSSSRSGRRRSIRVVIRWCVSTPAATWSATTRTAPPLRWPGGSAVGTSTTRSTRTRCWVPSPTAITRSPLTCPVCSHCFKAGHLPTPGRFLPARAQGDRPWALVLSRSEPGNAVGAQSVTPAGQSRPAPPPCKRRTRRSSPRPGPTGEADATASCASGARNGRPPHAEMRSLGPPWM